MFILSRITTFYKIKNIEISRNTPQLHKNMPPPKKNIGRDNICLDIRSSIICVQDNEHPAPLFCPIIIFFLSFFVFLICKTQY